MGDFSMAVLSLAACVLAASTAAKLKSRKAYRLFRHGLGETRLLPARLLSAAAAGLASAEAVIAATLIAAAVLTAAAGPSAIPVAELALAATAFLTSVLAVGIAVVIRHGTPAPCACFGANSGRPLGRTHLVRNLSLLALTCAGLVGDLLAPGHPAVVGAVLAAGAGAVAALLFIHWDDLTELFAPIPPSLGATPAVRADRRRD
jgi:hypothetical protein